jgi:hypothetical protein
VVTPIVTPKKIMEKYIRKLTKKSRYSYFISLPKELVKQLGWKERQKLVLKPFGKGKIIIADWKK